MHSDVDQDACDQTNYDGTIRHHYITSCCNGHQACEHPVYHHGDIYATVSPIGIGHGSYTSRRRCQKGICGNTTDKLPISHCR